MPKRLLYIALFICGTLYSQAVCADTFAGIVLDENRTPLVGAAVEVPGSKNGTLTDNDGKFKITVPEKHTVTIKVTFIGFVPVTTSIHSGRTAEENIILMTPVPTEINEVVVTATRTPKTLKDVPVVTRLITEDEIKRTDASNVQELLTEELPGLEFGYAMSQETSLNMNGFGGSAVLFLVDGERLAGETLDNVD